MVLFAAYPVKTALTAGSVGSRDNALCLAVQPLYMFVKIQWAGLGPSGGEACTFFPISEASSRGLSVGRSYVTVFRDVPMPMRSDDNKLLPVWLSFIQGCCCVWFCPSYKDVAATNLKEILASQLCRKTAENLMEDFKKINEPWKICTEEGGLIQNFGEEASKIFKELTEIFDIETKIFKNTQSYLTSRAMFSENLIFLLSEIYEKLVSKLKEFSFQSFREAISVIQISNNIDMDIKASIDITEKYYNSKAKLLTPFFIGNSWILEKEKKELLNGVREIATERLQLARLQGVYLQKSRNPISLSFHYLHPHPFGKDLRLDSFTSSDSFDFNPEPSKRAGLMRQFVETTGNSMKFKIGEDSKSQPLDDLVYHKEAIKLFNEE